MTGRTRFPCPLCRTTVGRDVPIVAEFDLHSRPVTVADLSGCTHAAQFGHLEGLTPGEEWQLIDAALAAWARRPAIGPALPGTLRPGIGTSSLTTTGANGARRLGRIAKTS